MSHSVENFREGILLLLRKFLVSKSFMDEKWGYHVFPSKYFGLTVQKNFMGIPSMFQKIWGIEKFYAQKGVSQFSVEICLSHSAKKLTKGNLTNFGYQKC